jgi:hypothetical protein
MTDRSDIQTSFQFIDADEGRLPKARVESARRAVRRQRAVATYYSSRVSIRSARLKSSSVKPPLLCVEHQTDLVVSDIYVGVVFFFLSHLSDPVHKIDRIDKIIEFESALDLVFLQFPFRDLFHAILELALFDQVSHNGTTSITRKSFCNGKSSA